MAKSKLSQIAEVERLAELARNKRTVATPYNINETTKNVDGSSLDKNERKSQLARNEWTKQKPYDINAI